MRVWRLIGIALAAVILVCIGWSAWWYLGAEAEQRGVEAWLAKQRERGWQAEAASVEVTGFPRSFRLDVREIALADPANGWAWRAPALTATSDAWAPTRIALDWPAQQTIAVPGDRATVRAQSLDTLLDVRPGPALELREASTDLTGLTVKATSGWAAAAGSASVRVAERAEDLAPPNSYDIRITADDVRLPKELVDNIDPTGWLKPGVDRLTVIGHVALADPIDLSTVETGRLALRAASMREVGFQWGEMKLVISGAVQVDDKGYPVGSIQVEARQWRQIVRLAVSAGVIGHDTAAAATRAVEVVTALTGSGDDLSLPLNLSDGKVRIGPFAVADAPRLAPPRG